MEYIGIGILIVAIVAVCVLLILKLKTDSEAERINNLSPTMEQEHNEEIIEIKVIPLEAVEDRSKLIEITDRRLLGHVNNLVPGLAQLGNTINNMVQARDAVNRGVLHKVIIPAGEKLAKSKSMNDASRGFYHGVDGIKGHANIVAVEAPKRTSVATNSIAAAMSVASMVVGQYYMKQINDKLSVISDGLSKIADFQDNEYRSSVFSLIAHIKNIANFQTEILENNELRLSKISQLDSLEVECTNLLGHANLSINGFTKRKSRNYKEYEKDLRNIHTWFMYQTYLLDVLYKIAELRYTLHLGAVSKEQCIALLSTYTNQVIDTKQQLTHWHEEIIKRLGIDAKEYRRKQRGQVAIRALLPIPMYIPLPTLVDDLINFRSIEKMTAEMIIEQTSESESLHYKDTSELYDEDVQLIVEDGKIYYFPESNIEKKKG